METAPMGAVSFVASGRTNLPRAVILVRLFLDQLRAELELDRPAESRARIVAINRIKGNQARPFEAKAARHVPIVAPAD
jgi:hypothetical protein